MPPGRDEPDHVADPVAVGAQRQHGRTGTPQRLVHGRTLATGGRLFDDAGVSALPDSNPDDPPAVEVLLGSGIAREMGNDRKPEALATARNRERLAAGDTFELNDRSWLVVGVFESSGSAYDSEVWAKQSLVGKMFGKENYTTIVVRAAGAEAAQELRDFYVKDYTKSKVAAWESNSKANASPAKVP